MRFRCDASLFTAGLWGLVLLTAMSAAGCDGGESAGEHDSKVPPPAADSLLNDESLTALELEGGWMLPAPDMVWSRSRMLAILLLPLDADPASITVALNGRETTGDFLPVSMISRRWRQRADDLRQGAEHAGTGGADPTDRPSTGYMRRLQAVLEHTELEPGANLLTATFTAGDGRATRHEVAFSWQPRGRMIQCRVIRRTRLGDDDQAGARLVVTPLDGAPAVDLSPGISHPLHPWPSWRQRSFVLARNGRADIFLPKGRYRITATGGLLDGIDTWEVPATGDAEHQFMIQRQVELPGTTTVDFHVHASPSTDSVIPMAEQLAAFQAAGVDLLVASDHNVVTDYRPLIARLPAAAGRIRSLPGVEASLRAAGGGSYGHWNIWPLVPDPGAPPLRPGQVSSLGALAFPVVPSRQALRAGTAVADMMEAYRQQGLHLAADGQDADIPAGLEPLIQLNHPRGFPPNDARAPVARRNDWFNQAGWERLGSWPASFSRRAAGGTTALDFDALEIWNRSSRSLYQEVRDDWFAFLNHGIRRTATANTDTHTIAPELAGFPLNVVFLEEGQPAGPAVAVADLVQAVRAGRLVGTDGPVPLLTVSSGDGAAVPGGRLQALAGRVSVQVEVQAADWVPVGEIRLWANGEVVARTDDELLRADLELSADTWLVAEVGDLDGMADMAKVPGVYGELVPRGLALGFTNPVEVDVDGNGRFEPPQADGR